jgi:hypothetical protein
VAVLHDLLEDTRYTADDLRSLGYSEEILQALDLTRLSEVKPQDLDRLNRYLKAWRSLANEVSTE